MRWTERQRAMLREMGVLLWSRDDAAAGAAGSVDVAIVERSDSFAPPAGRSDAPGPTWAPVAGGAATAPSARNAATAAPEPTASSAATAPTSAARLAPADWLIVGDPFDGADPHQEQLLDNMLRAIGLARSAPARERRATFVALAAPAVAAADGDALAASIALVAPRCIVALGRAAAAAVLGSDAPLGNWRGRRHERDALPVVVTFSLAFLLRHPAEKAKAWADLCLAVAAVDSPAP